MRRVPLLGLGLAVSLALTACGSTVANTRSSAAGALQNNGGQGLAAAPGASTPTDNGLGGTTGAAPGALGTGGSAGGGIAGTTGGTTGGGTTGTTSATSGTTGGSTGSFTAGPGVTATTIQLGVPYCNDCATANGALGGGGQDPGDTRRYYQAAIDDVNARGGVLGRKLVPLFHEISASTNIDTSQQQVCEDFTKDHKVAALFFRGEITYQCAKNAGIIAMGGGGSGPMYARYPNLLAPSSIRLERLGAVTVKAMVKLGWNKPQAPKWPTGKIGLITWDTNEYKYAMEHGWLAALHESGLKESDVRYIAVPQSDKSIADASSAVASAVLSFQQKGIDHVFISDGPAGIFAGTGLTFLFLNTAKSQNYFPRYGFNTNNSPGWSNLPADEEAGMLAVDSGDSERINDEGIPLNPVRERCQAIMRKAGLPVGDTQTTNVAAGACEIAFFAEAVFQRATSGTTISQVIAAAESIGTSYRSPWSYGNRLSRTQHDGDAKFRNSRFDDACACMKYTSAPYEP